MNQIDVILGNDYLVLSQLFKNYVCMEGLYKFVFSVVSRLFDILKILFPMKSLENFKLK